MADKAIEPGKKSTERYLPEKAWAAMSKSERKKTDDKSNQRTWRESRKGKQFVENTERAKKARKHARLSAKAEKERWVKVDTFKVRHLFQIICMKKFLASLFAAAAFASPVLAEDKVKTWRSFDSVGCMMLRECTEDVTATNLGGSWDLNILIAASELDAIIAALDKVGPLFLADEKYFAFRMRGVYDVRFNNIFLNKFYIDQPTKMIQVIRHEGLAHRAGLHGRHFGQYFHRFIQPEEDVPDWIRRGAERTYPRMYCPLKLKPCGQCMSNIKLKKL